MASFHPRHRFVLVSVVAALAAAAIAGVVEGAVFAKEPFAAAVGAGFSAVYCAPAGAVALLAVRGMWRAWKPEQLAEAAVEPGGGAPRLAAWLCYVGVGIALLAGVTFNAVKISASLTRARDVIALASTLAVGISSVLIVAGSLPVVGWLTRRLRAADLAWAAPRGTTLLRPRTIGLAALVGGAVYVYLAWRVTVRPRIGHLELDVATYVASYAVVAVAIQVVWRLVERRRFRFGVTVVSCSLVALLVATAAYARYERPFAMLDVWGRVPVGGFAVGLSFDLEEIRSELPLREIAPVERPGAIHPDIILITVDTFRADRAPVYGGPAVMRGLSAFSTDATVFEWAFSPGNVTRRSIPSLATGMSPRRMHGRVAGWALRMDPRHVMVAERLRAAGYDTAGFFCCRSHFSPDHRLGTDRGIEHLVIERDAAELTSQAQQWLEERERAGNRTAAFVWIHLIEPHGWQNSYPAKKYGKSKQKRYDKTLADIDRALSPLLEWVRQTPRRQQTAVIITSDHGEALGDHGHPTHATSLYNSEIRVPLVIFGPKVKARRVTSPVGLVDVTPTILDLAGFEPPGMPTMDGRSLGPILRGEVTPELEEGEAYATMMRDRSVAADSFALVSGRYKLIDRPGKPLQLYDMVADPNERRNLASKEPELADQLHEKLSARRDIDRVPAF